MITLNDLIKNINNLKILNFKNKNPIINSIIELNTLNDSLNNLMWINEKNINKIKDIKNGVLIIPEVAEEVCNPSFDVIYLISKNPRLTLNDIIKNFIKLKDIDKINNLNYFKNVKIGNGTIIEDGVEIGENTVIGYNNVIHSNTKIGSNCIIGSNNTIGGNGFGYEKNLDNIWERMEHIGGVEIKDFVEIGNNNCIDKGVISSTIIGENTKIDNLVHVAHNVKIGQNCLIIANSMIAGSVIIGDNTWISPSSSILNHTKIGRDSLVGIGSVVLKNVEEKDVVAGVPAKILRSTKKCAE
jgi:UDP-3-O-[3-hydroxymyristoyl] glucosamine N-acyltransferase